MLNETTIASLDNEILSRDIAYAQASVASASLLLYASFLHFPDEVRYIWKHKFTLSTFLYLLAQYSAILLLVSLSIQTILPMSLHSLRVCNSLGILAEALSICSYIGVQGMISLRTYSIYQGHYTMAIALSLTLLVPVVLETYVLTIPECSNTGSIISKLNTLIITRNIATVLLDGLAFIGIIHQVWRIWKLKRSLGLRSNGKDLVTSLLQQDHILHCLRFFFVLSITNIATILNIVQQVGIAVDVFSTFQDGLSVLMMCEFTLALRRRNANRSIPNQSALDLPTLSLPSQDDPVQTHRSILGRIQESLVAEMAERSDPAVIDIPHDIEPDDVQNVNPTTAI